MAVVGLRLYQSAQIEPSDLGEDIVNPADTEEQQKVAAIAWLESNVLGIADSEVSIPLLEATGYDSVADFINGRFSSVVEASRDKWIAKGEALYDGAVLSYGRSEVNKSVDSNAEGYDKDSDQDRIQANQRLAKLLSWVKALIASNGASADTSDDEQSIAHSTSVPVRAAFGYNRHR